MALQRDSRRGIESLRLRSGSPDSVSDIEDVITCPLTTGNEVGNVVGIGVGFKVGGVDDAKAHYLVAMLAMQLAKAMVGL